MNTRERAEMILGRKRVICRWAKAHRGVPGYLRDSMGLPEGFKFRPKGKSTLFRATHRLVFGTLRVRILALVKRNPREMAFARSPYKWRLVCSAPYKDIKYKHGRLTGLKFSNAKD